MSSSQLDTFSPLSLSVLYTFCVSITRRWSSYSIHHWKCYRHTTVELNCGGSKGGWINSLSWNVICPMSDWRLERIILSRLQCLIILFLKYLFDLSNSGAALPGQGQQWVLKWEPSYLLRLSTMRKECLLLLWGAMAFIFREQALSPGTSWSQRQIFQGRFHPDSRCRWWWLWWWWWWKAMMMTMTVML